MPSSKSGLQWARLRLRCRVWKQDLPEPPGNSKEVKKPKGLQRNRLYTVLSLHTVADSRGQFTHLSNGVRKFQRKTEGDARSDGKAT